MDHDGARLLALAILKQASDDAIAGDDDALAWLGGPMAAELCDVFDLTAQDAIAVVLQSRAGQAKRRKPMPAQDQTRKRATWAARPWALSEAVRRELVADGILAEREPATTAHRRRAVAALASKGLSRAEVARRLGMSRGMVSKDFAHLGPAREAAGLAVEL
jgi:hypothetical protein